LADTTNNDAPDEDASDGEKKAERPMSNLWWQQYTVRYFIGTIVGIFVIFLLRAHGPLHCEIASLIPRLEDIDAKKLIAVAALGLAYCYVASAPILTLHAVRGSVKMDSGWFNIAMLALVTAPIWMMFGVDHYGVAPLQVTALVIIVGGQCLLIVLASLGRFRRLKQFYDDLVEARLYNWSTKRDYVDSYRHLREHGNALAIVFCELALGAILSTVQTGRDGLVVIALWVAPGAWCWVVGSVLEAHFAQTNPPVAPPAPPSTPVAHP
jgi:hypothetical protein